MCALAETQTESFNYRLGPSDEIHIQVFQEDDISLTTVISPNGNINYPLIGKLKLSGLTLSEAEAMLDGKLRGDYLIDPQINISIVKYRPFFITGEVKNPGSYEFKPDMNARQAVAMAGGFTDRASRRKAYLIREGDPTSQQIKIELHEKLNAGDTIIIKESFF